jgi:hypothetical protein
MNWQWLNLNAAEYDQPPSPPTTCGIIYPGRRHMFSGPPESLKTLLAFVVALEHIRAGHGPVAHIDFEMYAVETRRLLVDLGATAEEIEQFWHVEPDGPPDQDDIAAMVESRITLAIIDAAAGAYDVSGLDDSKRKEAEAFARQWIKPLFDAGIASVVLDHVVENSDTRGRYAIGSERKTGAVDVHLGFTALKQLARGGNGLVKITTRSGAAGSPGQSPRSSSFAPTRQRTQSHGRSSPPATPTAPPESGDPPH